MPAVDHLVIDVRDQLDQAAETYRALGFQLTERGYHTLGSANHLAIFGTNYLELLGMGRPGSPIRPELVAFPPGLNGLVFTADDADGQYRDLQARDITMLPPQSFSRPVALDGEHRDARFRTTHLAPGQVPFGRMYFCQHFTRDLVWRAAWQRHPNGATDIVGVLISAADPAAVAELFGRMHGVAAMRQGPALRLMAGGVAIDIASHAAVASQLGEALPVASDRSAFVAAMRVRTASLQQVRDVLGNIPSVTDAGCIRVPAKEACNVALEFVA